MAVLGIGINTDASCAALATQEGYTVFSLDPPQRITHRDIGGLKRVAMQGRGNILGLVGGGERPYGPQNTVVLYDDKEGKAVAEIEYKLPVLNVIFRRDRMVVVTCNMVYVYSMPDLRELKRYDTIDNLSGIISVSTETTDGFCAMPGKQCGHVHVVDLEEKDPAPPLMIPAHRHPLSAVALSFNGRLLATASSTGSIIRVWKLTQKNTKEGPKSELLYVFRRGFTSATIHSIAFSKDASLLLANSDKTIHVFSLTKPEVVSTATMTLNTMTDMLPALEPLQSSRSGQQFQMPCASLCAFGGNDTVIAITQDGLYYQFSIKDKEQIKFQRLLKPKTEDIFQ